MTILTFYLTNFSAEESVEADVRKAVDFLSYNNLKIQLPDEVVNIRNMILTPYARKLHGKLLKLQQKEKEDYLARFAPKTIPPTIPGSNPEGTTSTTQISR